MKRNLLIAVSLILLTNCTNEVLQDTKVTHIRVSASDVQMVGEETRTAFQATTSGLSFTWSTKDTVGIYPNEGDQVSFPMSQGAGTKSAVFDGGGWSVRTGFTYSAYYPFNMKNHGVAYSKVPLTYRGQKQHTNNSTYHLAAYDYMAATASSPSNGDILFDFNHLSSFLNLKFICPRKETFDKLYLSVEENAFVSDATVDISTGEISPTNKISYFSLLLNNISVEADEILSTWIAIAPIDLSGKKLSVTLSSASGLYTSELYGGKYLGSTAYQQTLNLNPPSESSAPANNPIWGNDNTLNGYKYIDLGLPSGTLWAVQNIGAEKPEDFGKYYAWGETKARGEVDTSNKHNYTFNHSYTKTQFFWDTYKYCTGRTGDTNTRLTKYNSFDGDGLVDDKVELELEDDAAYMNWGSGWRIPSWDQLNELIDERNSTSKIAILNDVQGYLITSKTNGESLFLPFAGFASGGDICNAIQGGYYWSRTLDEDRAIFAQRLDFQYGSHRFYNMRHMGCSIRPVCKK